MKMLITKILSCLLFAFSSLAAWSNTHLKAAFQNTFNTHYTAGRCGDNILSLLERADAQRIDLTNANIIEISNKGNSLFGLINSEFARGGGRLNPTYPASGPRNLPGENNWHHHVFLEQDGLIYDYDFGNEPRVVSTKAYFEKMFLIEKRTSEGGTFYIGREDKLKDYEILIRPGLETIIARRNRQASPDGERLRMGEYLRLYSR